MLPTANATAGNLRVLVCGEERHIVRLIQIYLEKKGHTVVCAFDSLQAISLVGSAEFDRVILNASMPNAYDVLVAVGDRTTLLVSSEREKLSWERKVRRPHNYVVKPFNPATILD